MSTNSRIMISTPTAIYSRRKKKKEKSERETAETGPHTYIHYRRELLASVYVCEYYYAVIVTDFLMRAKKEENIKITSFFFHKPHRALTVCEYVSKKKKKKKNETDVNVCVRGSRVKMKMNNY